MSRTALAFMSYVNEDDRHDNGWMTQFRERLSGEVRMHIGEPFDIFQDRKDIAWGQQWQERINQSLDAVTFLIPILTPAFFKSTACRDELERFLKREETLGRSDLILPVYYVNCPVLQDKAKREQDELAQVVAARQYADWRELRFEDFTSPQLRKALAKIAQQIVAALERSRKEFARAAAQSENAAKETRPPPQVEKSGKEPDSSSNTFQSKGGEQNIAQGSNAIGTQINYYGPQVLPPDKPKPKPVVRKSIVAIAFMCVALLVVTYYFAQSDNQANVVTQEIIMKDGSGNQIHPMTQAKPAEPPAIVETVKPTKVEKPPDKDILSRVFRKSYAVVIGISSYQNHSAWETLDNAVNDAEAMHDFLSEQGFTVKRFVGREATKSNIVSYLEDTLAPRLERDDRFVFYFSGHGNTRGIGGSDRGYIIPYDGDAEKSSTWIAMEQLQEMAAKLGNARHQLFIFDSAFGALFAATNGIFGGSFSTNVTTNRSMRSIPDGIPEYIATITSSRARQYLTAGGTNEEIPASSNLDGYRAYSYYTAYLLKGLREGVADSYPDGFITASELEAYLEVLAATPYNTPRGGHFSGHKQGNFVFRSPKPAQILQ